MENSAENEALSPLAKIAIPQLARRPAHEVIPKKKEKGRSSFAQQLKDDDEEDV